MKHPIVKKSVLKIKHQCRYIRLLFFDSDELSLPCFMISSSKSIIYSLINAAILWMRYRIIRSANCFVVSIAVLIPEMAVENSNISNRTNKLMLKFLSMNKFMTCCCCKSCKPCLSKCKHNILEISFRFNLK